MAVFWIGIVFMILFCLGGALLWLKSLQDQVDRLEFSSRPALIDVVSSMGRTTMKEPQMRTVELSQEDCNVVAAILMTHAAMQDQGAANATEIQTRLMRDEPGDAMIETLSEQVDVLELDAVNLRKIADLFV
jgi:hypothetical protein